MHITGDVTVFDLDSWDVKYKGVALEMIIDELLERIGLEIASESSETVLEETDDGRS